MRNIFASIFIILVCFVTHIIVSAKIRIEIQSICLSVTEYL